MSEIEKMVKELGLKEEDLTDIVVEDGDLPEDTARWMATPRVHQDKPCSKYWSFMKMRVTWDLAQEVKFRPLRDNLYTLQFSSLRDRELVMREGPWTFKNKVVVIKPYDGFTRSSTVELNKVEIWIQMHDVRDLLFHMIKPQAATIGEFIYAEPKSQDVNSFLRGASSSSSMSGCRTGVLFVGTWVTCSRKVALASTLHWHLFSKTFGPSGSGVQDEVQEKEEMQDSSTCGDYSIDPSDTINDTTMVKADANNKRDSTEVKYPSATTISYLFLALGAAY
ncbi:hypothetical protein D1007_49145 [Hordeum vulgare]|nr:hypothetical protein D1007_49145 [Hordeum vulgare]